MPPWMLFKKNAVSNSKSGASLREKSSSILSQVSHSVKILFHFKGYWNQPEDGVIHLEDWEVKDITIKLNVLKER